MSDISIAPYFPFGRVRVTRQSVSDDGTMSWVVLEPDERFTPTCSVCGGTASAVHQYTRRAVRDLCLCEARVLLNVEYRKIECPTCDCIRVEHHDFVAPYARVTHRLARYIYELCKHMPIRAVAEHVGLDWKTVKEKDFGQTRYEGLRILAIDEISIRRGHTYMTVILNYESGAVVWMGEGRSVSTLDGFFSNMPETLRAKIEAIAIDMWDPFIKAVSTWCPNARIVFDLFHVVKAFGKVIDTVRNEEASKARKQEKDIYKGSKYLLLKNKENLTPEQQPRLRYLLDLNKTLASVYILKDYLKQLWRYRYRRCAKRFLHLWRQLAYAIPYSVVHKFASMLGTHSYGILNHCDYPIHTGVLEGCTNKRFFSKRVAEFPAIFNVNN
jgi:transposase